MKVGLGKGRSLEWVKYEDIEMFCGRNQRLEVEFTWFETQPSLNKDSTISQSKNLSGPTLSFVNSNAFKPITWTRLRILYCMRWYLHNKIIITGPSRRGHLDSFYIFWTYLIAWSLYPSSQLVQSIFWQFYAHTYSSHPSEKNTKHEPKRQAWQAVSLLQVWHTHHLYIYSFILLFFYSFSY